MDHSDITQQVMEIVLLLAPFLPYFILRVGKMLQEVLLKRQEKSFMKLIGNELEKCGIY